MAGKSKHRNANDLDDFADDFEATEIEMKGVTYTGLCVLIIVLGLIGAALYAIW